MGLSVNGDSTEKLYNDALCMVVVASRRAPKGGLCKKQVQIYRFEWSLVNFDW